MTVNKITSNPNIYAETSAHVPASPLKSTNRFAKKMESRVENLGKEIHRSFKAPDHDKFKAVANADIAPASPEVLAFRKTLEK